MSRLAARLLLQLLALPARAGRIAVATARLRGRRPLIVFDIEAVGLREHFEPVVAALLAEGSCDCALVVADAEHDAYSASAFCIRHRSRLPCLPATDFRFIPCRPAVTVSFHPENGSALARGFAAGITRRVVMQHGLSDKAAFGEVGRADPLADFDVVFLTGPVFREGSLRAYRDQHPATFERLTVVEVGSPKTDAILAQRHCRDDVLRDLRLPLERRTVCYAPTWERLASLEQAGEEIVAALASLEVNVVVKLHHASLCREPYDWVLRDGHGGKDWRRVFRELEARYPNVRLAPGHDATPYLAASDLLVSDASGVAYEFLLLDRPLVFYDVPALFDHYGRNGVHDWGRGCGEIVSDPLALRAAVERNLAAPALRQRERAEWIPRLLYHPGRAIQRATELLVELAHEPRRAPRSPGS